MSTFFLFGKYSADAMQRISGQRTRQVCQAVEQLGGKVKEIYALLGEYDLVMIVELPNMADAMRAAVILGRTTGISFSTSAAMSVDEFDRMVEGL